MEYTVNGLARLSGVSTRTLRYYDQIGLLKPLRVEPNGYRIYGEAQVDALQQIRFYTELGFSLKEIGCLTRSPEFDRERALAGHLLSLKEEQARLGRLIENVERTLKAQSGGREMSDTEKFEGFKRELVQENERRYGAEVRKKYGNSVADASNEKLLKMTEAEYKDVETLTTAINAALAAAVETGDPAGTQAQAVCDMHRRWLCKYWPDGMYSKEAHAALAEGYVEDPRFRGYYDAVAPGAARFLHDAILIYCRDE